VRLVADAAVPVRQDGGGNGASPEQQRQKHLPEAIGRRVLLLCTLDGLAVSSVCSAHEMALDMDLPGWTARGEQSEQAEDQEAVGHCEWFSK
jgi:hypothetical protein